MTNSDRIRALPNEVLAKIIRRCCISSSCVICPVKKLCNYTFRSERGWYDWLEREAEE